MSMLAGVKKTRQEAPVRLLVHGPGGCGKSTFAAAAPSPIFSQTEDGLTNIDTHAFPLAKSWAEVLAQVDSLATEPHTYKTYVLDSLDHAEPLCWAAVCDLGDAKGKRMANIEAFGYGKGYVAALDQWRVYLSKLETLRRRGMNIILIAHSVRKSVKNPEGDDYEQWQIKLHDKAAGLIKEWVEVVGYASLEVLTLENENGRVKGITSGKRVLKTAPAAGYDGKTRFSMPATMPLDWPTFAQAVHDGGAGALDRLKGEFTARLVELADADTEAKARAFIASRGESVASLTEAINSVNSYITERKAAS
jgi:hypothetical protein